MKVFGINFDALTMQQAVDAVLSWCYTPDGRCRYIVTPNVNHVVQLEHNKQFQAAYRGAALVLADGKPVVLASRLLHRRLPQTVPGSDLVPAILGSANSHQGLKVYLLGAGPGVAEQAARNIQTQWPKISIVGTYSPPFGFEHDPSENSRIIKQLSQAESDLLVLGLGAPKQEIWIHQHASQLSVPVALCVGATIDFIAGKKKRAPKWMRSAGLEWLHRLLSEPHRLVRRYCRDAVIFPRLLLREFRGNPD